jgi:hypothetical protein
MRNIINSPYSAAFTAGSLMHAETNAILPLLMSADSDELIAEEIRNNNRLLINSEKSRQRKVAEIRRRFNICPNSFWAYYGQLSETVQPIFLFFVCLKTYKLLFDIHFNVTTRLWNQGKTTVELFDYEMAYEEIGSKDSFVDSWSALTKKKCISVYLTMLKQAGFIKDETYTRPSISDDELVYFVKAGESWFLEACFVPAYEINEIKATL